MEFSFTDEQNTFREVLRRFLEEKSPSTEVRRLMETETGYDPGVWRAVSEDLGLPGIHIPERYGGQGFGFVELGIVLEEMGRALLCAPYLGSSVLAAGAILHGGTEAQRSELLPSIASGETIAALAFAEPHGDWDPAAVTATATRTNDGWRLEGTKSFVLDGHTADLLVVAARAPGSTGTEGLSLFTVPGGADGLERTLLQTMDPTRKQARIVLGGARGELLGEEGAAAEALERTLDEGRIALANEMVGGAERLLESAVDYAKMRVQFGRPIGSFQAIKHMCADMLLDVELAKSGAYYAAAAAAGGDPDVPALAALAKANAGEVCVKTAADTIQIHGGIGFTWENDTHLWFKRARTSELYLGDPAWLRERLMRLWDV